MVRKRYSLVLGTETKKLSKIEISTLNMCLSHESTIYGWNSQELVVNTMKSWEKKWRRRYLRSGKRKEEVEDKSKIVFSHSLN